MVGLSKGGELAGADLHVENVDGMLLLEIGRWITSISTLLHHWN